MLLFSFPAATAWGHASCTAHSGTGCAPWPAHRRSLCSCCCRAAAQARHSRLRRPTVTHCSSGGSRSNTSGSTPACPSASAAPAACRRARARVAGGIWRLCLGNARTEDSLRAGAGRSPHLGGWVGRAQGLPTMAGPAAARGEHAARSSGSAARGRRTLPDGVLCLPNRAARRPRSRRGVRSERRAQRRAGDALAPGASACPTQLAVPRTETSTQLVLLVCDRSVYAACQVRVSTQTIDVSSAAMKRGPALPIPARGERAGSCAGPARTDLSPA
jgi:hypothetical protein